MAVMSDVGSRHRSAPQVPLEAGRDALARHAWPEAFELLSEADRETGALSGTDLESLALAAFFAARADVELDVKERAFKAYEAEGNEPSRGVPRGRHRPDVRLCRARRRSPRPGRAGRSG